MPQILTTIPIARPVAEVFEYVTTANHWMEWHPSTRGVQGAVDHSGLVGETIREVAVVAGRQGTITWQVQAREAPYRWVIAGSNPGQGTASITYTLSERDGGTLFERTLRYQVANPWFAVIAALFLQRRILAESEEALRRLKARLEAGTHRQAG